MNQQSFSTRAIHSGEGRDPSTGAHNTPIYQTATFIFESAEELVERYGSPFDGFFYSRSGNPTTAKLEKKLADLIGSEECLATSSGMAAISLAVMIAAKCGDHILVSEDVFINSYQFFTEDCPDMGIEASLVNLNDIANLEAAVRPNTKLIFAEVITNPTVYATNLPPLRNFANKHKLTLIVDNTYLSPYLFQPIKWGADIVIHSTTKYLGGHGDAVGGVIASNNANINKARRKHGRFGQCLSPFNSWLILRGLRTLPMRLRQHSANALALANFLNEHPKIEWVRYPGLANHPQSEWAQTYLSNGFGGVLVFKVPGGFEEMCRIMNMLQLCQIGTSLGDVYTLASPQESHDNTVRISVGCEDITDIIADFSQALSQL
ncbi:MAG: methionine-gamma-lyase [Candidatus Promineifilaceae bacterium]|jgi:methionine-gamma-lyase